MNAKDITQKDPPAPLVPFEEALLNTYSDSEMRKFIYWSPCLLTTREEAVTLLSPNLVVKQSGRDPDQHYLDEALALRRARSVGLRAPKVHRMVPMDDENEDEGQFLILERVHGSTLEQLWPTIRIWTLFSAAWQLRGYLRTLRGVGSSTTGGLHSGWTHSTRLDAIHGPIRHASPSAFVGYLNWWLLDCRPGILTPRQDLVLQPEQEHILVHQDLAPRNMILDNSGKLWLVDWGHAGFYPPFMEFLGIEARTSAMPWLTKNTWSAWWGCVKWSFFRWVAAGPSSSHQRARKALACVSIRTQRYRMDRSPFSDSSFKA
ncbi:kinase-like protein [Cylindrobasidium torrendii FP15055 ss-10]|uniref:Kinase-like protein n=1 Tax=Cylindrobasidium torrendii FP15055 ss-10 TaxID=1314674 RepID=A0A0D7BSN7_9AGAR|nr:kinase-like protein [Cylindrobasidium torrendii FP15055 ss-10]